MRYLQATDEIEITVELNQLECWFGLVLGQADMAVGGDMIAFTTFQNKVVYLSSVGFSRPSLVRDATRSEFTYADERSREVFTLRRALDTGSSSEYVIPLDQAFTIGYAYNDKDYFLDRPYDKHNFAGSLTVTLKSDGSYVFEPTVPDPVPAAADNSSSPNNSPDNSPNNSPNDQENDTTEVNWLVIVLPIIGVIVAVIIILLIWYKCKKNKKVAVSNKIFVHEKTQDHQRDDS